MLQPGSTSQVFRRCRRRRGQFFRYEHTKAPRTRFVPNLAIGYQLAKTIPALLYDAHPIEAVTLFRADEVTTATALSRNFHARSHHRFGPCLNAITLPCCVRP